jgi:CMP/dCMP kinase
MIIAIDGPAGSGKSTTARAVARLLGFRHLDSGAFYRAITLAVLDAGIPLERWPELTAEDLDALGVHARAGDGGYRLHIHERDVSEAIRAARVNAHVSHAARIPAVRDWLLGRLRAAAAAGDLVADGRDIGTVVFPDAEVKVFLVAEPRERARRRLAEQGIATPMPQELDAEVERLLSRDRIDSERTVAPLRQAPDAARVDTTALDFAEQVERIVALARARRGRTGERGGG